MHIKLEDNNPNKVGEYYLGTKERLGSATSITFLNSDTFITTTFVGMKMYLYRFDFEKNSYNLLDSLDTTYNNTLCYTDLAHSYNNLIICSNFELGTQTIYKFDNDKLSHYLDVKSFVDPQYCHGVKFYKWIPNMICATGNKVYYIDFIDYIKQTLEYRFSTDMRPQDIDFISENRMVVLCTTSTVTNIPVEESSRVIKILYYEIDILNKKHKLLDTYLLDDAHGDSIIYYDNHLYLTDQYNNNIVVVKVENDKLIFNKNISGYSYPHGLAIEPNNKLLGVSNYGDNSIIIKSLE